MEIHIKDVLINYVDYGKKDGEVLILLHGWGQNIEMMKPIGDAFQDKCRIVILDLPGFGKSSEPPFAWSLDDYSDMLSEFISQLKINKPIIIGHSFGGRLAIRYSGDAVISKLVLFGSPVRPERNSPSLKVRILKFLKRLPGMNNIGEVMKKYIGSSDYKNASTIMRQVLVNTVNKDLVDYAKKIEEPTILIWGDYDLDANISDAKVLEDVMTDASLIVLPGTHYAYLENLPQVISILDSFIGG